MLCPKCANTVSLVVDPGVRASWRTGLHRARASPQGRPHAAFPTGNATGKADTALHGAGGGCSLVSCVGGAVSDGVLDGAERWRLEGFQAAGVVTGVKASGGCSLYGAPENTVCWHLHHILCESCGSLCAAFAVSRRQDASRVDELRSGQCLHGYPWSSGQSGGDPLGGRASRRGSPQVLICSAV